MLVFAHHHDVMDAFDDALTKSKTKFVRIDGKTLGKERQERVQKFQNQTGVRVALLSITAAGVRSALYHPDYLKIF